MVPVSFSVSFQPCEIRTPSALIFRKPEVLFVFWPLPTLTLARLLRVSAEVIPEGVSCRLVDVAQRSVCAFGF